MSSALDKALLAMTIEEEDTPFDLPNLPQYSSCQNNSISLIGRILNPDCQKISNLIREMPRKWQKYDRVRGIALSSERFQFIFKHEHDLVEVYEKGVHSSNDWTIAMERWMEKPPPDYLNFVHIWVRIRNIPVNHYTAEAIEALGDLVGHVDEVAFDPSKPQSNDYVRVKILFDVSKPLSKTKVVNLPSGGQAIISYEYERIHKRCFHCQRLTHEQTSCPFKIRSLQNNQNQRRPLERVIKDSDPLFGVLDERQVGINPSTGRPKIANEVLEGMRLYLLSSSGSERIIREHRVKSSLADIGNDLRAQKSYLSLETPPKVTFDVDKGKGHVFGFDKVSSQPSGHHDNKLMASAIQVGRNFSENSAAHFFSEGSAHNFNGDPMLGMELSSVNSAKSGEAGSSGWSIATKTGKPRGRPPRNKRLSNEAPLKINQSSNTNTTVKRKAEEEPKRDSTMKRKLNEAVPMEGLPKDQ